MNTKLLFNETKRLDLYDMIQQIEVLNYNIQNLSTLENLVDMDKRNNVHGTRGKSLIKLKKAESIDGGNSMLRDCNAEK